MKITKSIKPVSSLTQSYLPADYSDVYECKVNSEKEIIPDDIMVGFWTDFPAWVNVLFKLRNFLVKFVGLKGEQQTYVVSRHSCDEKENIRFITENIIETITELRNEEGKDIWLIGGGEIISMLLDADLVDELQIFYMPVMLGDGICLFPSNKSKEVQWNLLESKTCDNGVLEAKYQRK